MSAITSPQMMGGTFLATRIKRIVSVYWLATSVFLISALIGLFPNVRIDLQYIISSYLFILSIGPGQTEISPMLVPGRKLNYEM